MNNFVGKKFEKHRKQNSS